MKTLTTNIPSIAEIDDKEARMSLASTLYERGKRTLGQAAELAGYSKETFMELLADYNVPLVNYPADELDEDIKKYPFATITRASTRNWPLVTPIEIFCSCR